VRSSLPALEARPNSLHCSRERANSGAVLKRDPDTPRFRLLRNPVFLVVRF